MQNRSRRSNFSKRWLRRTLAVLLELLLFAEAGAVRAQGNSLGSETIVDQNTVEANAIELLQEGDQLLQEGSVKSLQQAINVCQEAQQQFQEVGNHSGEAAALNCIGSIYNILGDKQQALIYLQQALILLQAAGNQKSEADALNNIGLIYSNWGDRESASDYYNRALQLHQVEGNQAGQAATLNNLATLYMFSDPSRAQDYLLRALLLARASEDRAGEGSIYNTACVIYMRLGDIAGGLKVCLTALKIHQETGNEAAAAATLANIGGLLRVGNNEPQALEFFNWALSSYRAVGDRSGEASTLFSIAGIYRNQGNLEAALEKVGAVVNIFEDLRTDINSESLRISFFATSLVQLGYKFSISLLTELVFSQSKDDE